MVAENTSLAPASGSGIGKLLADALLADPSFLEKMKAAAIGGLEAMCPPRWDKDAKAFMTDTPDFRVRIQTLALLLAHMEGEPIKRIIHQHLGGPQLDPQKALRDSPALLEAMEHEIEKAKFRTRNVKPAGKPDAGPVDLVHSEDVPN